MTIIIDYGLGNLGSILNILHIIGEKASISKDPEVILNADRLILPGVGSFDEGMNNLKKNNLIDVIKKAASKGVPILGICLGMQLLGRSSEEGKLEGLNLIPFETKRFVLKDKTLKIPHMGWDIISIKEDNELTKDMSKDEQRFYFVHSYYAVCDSKENSMMTCDYGITFSAGVRNKNVYGVQFHPEKSHSFGIKLFENFVRIKNVQ